MRKIETKYKSCKLKINNKMYKILNKISKKENVTMKEVFVKLLEKGLYEVVNQEYEK